MRDDEWESEKLERAALHIWNDSVGQCSSQKGRLGRLGRLALLGASWHFLPVEVGSLFLIWVLDLMSSYVHILVCSQESRGLRIVVLYRVRFERTHPMLSKHRNP